MKKKKQCWLPQATCLDTMPHHAAEVWIEIHHPADAGEVYLVIDTSGCDAGYGPGIVGIYDNFADASNRIGEEYGFDEFWKKL